MRPPREIPEELRQEFTMGGLVNVKEWYFDDTMPSSVVASEAEADKFMAKLQSGNSPGYEDTGHWLADAYKQYPLTHLDVVIFGSRSISFECQCRQHGARRVNVVDYRPLENVDIPWLRTYTPVAWECSQNRTEAVIAVSSIEHSGLGRYGDPLDPNGDLLAMQWIRHFMRPRGLLYLAVPVSNEDWLVWNAHRIYGPHRLPLLLSGWKQLAVFGHGGNQAEHIQPVFVLEPRLED